MSVSRGDHGPVGRMAMSEAFVALQVRDHLGTSVSDVDPSRHRRRVSQSDLLRIARDPLAAPSATVFEALSGDMRLRRDLAALRRHFAIAVFEPLRAAASDDSVHRWGLDSYEIVLAESEAIETDAWLIVRRLDPNCPVPRFISVETAGEGVSGPPPALALPEPVGEEQRTLIPRQSELARALRASGAQPLIG